MRKSTALIVLTSFEVFWKKKLIRTFNNKVNNISGSNVKTNMQNSKLSKSSETRECEVKRPYKVSL
jgi:hypothetical protein